MTAGRSESAGLRARLIRLFRRLAGRALRLLGLSPSRVRTSADNLVHRIRAEVDTGSTRAQWHFRVFLGRTGRFTVHTLTGNPDTAALPVIMCLWNRPQRIDEILAQLDAQTDARPVRLLLWNNQASDDSHYRTRIAAFRATGSLSSVEYVCSPHNLGGLARFFLARQLLRDGYRGHVVLLDDDEDVTAEFTTSMLRYAKPREIAGWWAYNYIDSHWNRTIPEPGEIADYAGTGGSILDVSIVQKASFFTELPSRFGFLEDQWLCGYAQKRGWIVRKADVDITFVLDETNQFHALADLKNEFRTYLAR